MMTFDNAIDLATQPVNSSQTKNWFLLSSEKNDVTIKLYLCQWLIAGSFNFILQEQNQCDL